ncbi:MAG: hypothetical protein M3T56_05135, partial [Chloroflexota bacterium]|nr:hypothetical protein [Chloroflexota bacterium]
MNDPKPPALGVDVGKFLREPSPETESPRDASETGRGTGGGRIPARMSFVTLAVRDMPKMTRFYRQFRWPESKFSDESFVAFKTSGAVLGLFPAKNYEKEFGPVVPPGVFRGFVLAINLEDPARVDAAYETMKRFDGIRIL